MRLLFIYLLQALRSLRKDGLQTFVVITGFMMGLVCMTFSVNWLWNETHYETFRDGYEHLYQVCRYSEGKDGGKTVEMNLSEPMCRVVKDSIPEVEDAVVYGLFYEFDGMDRYEAYNDEGKDVTASFLSNSVWAYATPNWFVFFGQKLVHGDEVHALERPEQIVLSVSQARAVFGTDDVCGRTLELRNSEDEENKMLTVGGVMEDAPENTTLSFKVLLPYEFWVNQQAKGNWYWLTSFIVYKTYKEEWVESRLQAYKEPDGSKREYGSIPFRLAHVMNAQPSLMRALLYPLSFTGLSLLLLLSVIFNYMSLLSVRFGNRLREFKLRLSLGGTFGKNMIWLCSEVIVVYVAAVLLALVALDLLAGWPEVSLQMMDVYAMFGPCALATLLVLLCFVTVLVFRLKRNYRNSFNGKTLRRTRHIHLLFVQLFVCSLFIFVLFNVYRQFRMMTNVNMGMNVHNVLKVRFDRISCELQEEFVNQVNRAGSPVVERAVASPFVLINPAFRLVIGSYSREDVEAYEDFFYGSLSLELMDFFDMRLRYGNRPERYADEGKREVLLNARASELINYDGRNEMVLKTRCGNDKIRVLGIVDLLSSSYKNDAMPYIYYLQPRDKIAHSRDVAYVRFVEGREEEARRYIDEVLNHMDILAYHVKIENEEDNVRNFYKQERTYIRLFTLITAASLLITLFGVYSVVSYTLRSRRKSIAIRRIFGATDTMMYHSYLRRYVISCVLAVIVAYPVGLYLVNSWLEGYAERVSVGWLHGVVIGVLLLLQVCSIVLYRVYRTLNENPADVVKEE